MKLLPQRGHRTLGGGWGDDAGRDGVLGTAAPILAGDGVAGGDAEADGGPS